MFAAVVNLTMLRFRDNSTPVMDTDLIIRELGGDFTADERVRLIGNLKAAVDPM